MVEKFYPRVENLGKECSFWCLDEGSVGCNFPKAQLQGRTSCEGLIDDVCVFLKDGVVAESLSPELQAELRTRTSFDNLNIPPGSY